MKVDETNVQLCNWMSRSPVNSESYSARLVRENEVQPNFKVAISIAEAVCPCTSFANVKLSEFGHRSLHVLRMFTMARKDMSNALPFAVCRFARTSDDGTSLTPASGQRNVCDKLLQLYFWTFKKFLNCRSKTNARFSSLGLRSKRVSGIIYMQSFLIGVKWHAE